MRAAPIALAFVAALAAAEPTAAQSPAAAPARRTAELVDAWASANLKADGYSIVDRTPGSVTLFRLVEMQDTRPMTVRGWTRTEYIDPPSSKDRFRSAAALYDFDCAGMRFRPLAADFYGELNRGGPVLKTEDVQAPTWTYARPDSTDEFVLAAACRARADARTKAEARAAQEKARIGGKTAP